MERLHAAQSVETRDKAACQRHRGESAGDVERADERQRRRAEVVVIPIPAGRPPGVIGPHISVSIAGKCAVMKDS